jgi:hypothetical protein
MQLSEPHTYEVMGRTVRVPVEVAQASAVSATYLASSGRVQAWIAASGLRVLPVAPGQTVVSIAGLRYEQGDWGRYDEVCIATPVLAPGATSVIGALRERAIGLYLRYLPVTDEFSCRAGVELYGFPKWVADISLSQEPRHARLYFASEQKQVLTLDARCPTGSRSFAPVSIDAYSHREGALWRCRFTVAGEGVSVRPGGARLKLGVHAIAGELEDLCLSRHALCVSRIARMRASFGAPEIVRQTR